MANHGQDALLSRCVSSLCESLGKAATDTEIQVHCGGSLMLSKPAKLFSGSQAVSFPLSRDDLNQLKLQSEPASFGRGKEETLDPEYRQAVKLASEKVACNFDLSNWSVLTQIKQVLMPHSQRAILAQLDKVNLYTVGGFFKAHKDTLRSQAMFGSLVLCLPSPFEGGQLVIKHKSGQKVYDWGKGAANSQQLQWAAFYSDCTHEILSVTEGVRVTVTYNLFVDDVTAEDHLSRATTKFSDELAEVLSQAGFLPNGGILGFACEHAYPREEKLAGLAGFLKGADAVVLAAAQQLKLKAELLPVWHDDLDEDLYYDDGEEIVGDTFSFHLRDTYEERVNHVLHEDVRAAYRREEITWCTPDRRAWAEDHTVASYGNEPSTSVVYSAAAIFMHVPAWSERQLPAA